MKYKARVIALAGVTAEVDLDDTQKKQTEAALMDPTVQRLALPKADGTGWVEFFIAHIVAIEWTKEVGPDV